MVTITIIILCLLNRECLLGAYYVPCALQARGTAGNNTDRVLPSGAYILLVKADFKEDSQKEK